MKSSPLPLGTKLTHTHVLTEGIADSSDNFVFTIVFTNNVLAAPAPCPIALANLTNVVKKIEKGPNANPGPKSRSKKMW